MARLWLPFATLKNGVLTKWQGKLGKIFNDVVTIGEAAFDKAWYEKKSITGAINFPKLEKIENAGARNTFSGSNISSVSFPKLREVASSGLAGCFEEALSGKISFPSLTTIGVRGLEYTFFKTNASEVVCPILQNCLNSGAFENCFRESKIKKVDFPSLVSVGERNFYSSFKDCTLLEEVNFPKLKEIGYSSFLFAFEKCTNLKTVSFPSLTTIKASSSITDSFNYAFDGCINLKEIHFRADAKSVIEAESQYSSKFGATNATIFFDL